MDRPGSAKDAEAIRLELERILASEVFFSAQRSQAFLRYVVEKSIAGLVPKEYEVAVDVLGRSAAYDPTVDSSVRVEAGRLRNRLREYYDTQGKQDPVLIEIPKGGYSAVFSKTSHEPDGPAAPVAVPTPGSMIRERTKPTVPAGTTNAGLLRRPDAANAPETTSQEPPRSRRALVWTTLCATLCFAVVFSMWLFLRWERGRTQVRSLAVLPLQNLSGDPAQDYFAAGMTDELTTELAHIEGLRVVSRTSAVLASQGQKSLAQIADALNVDAVVEGSVLRSGNQIRITAQLIDARSDKHLWAQSFEGQANDVLSLQDTVAHQIATQTRVALTPADRTRLSTVHTIQPEAHDDYLRGLYFIQRREAERAAQYFRSAINLEPTYAPAWAGLAQALMLESVANGKPAAQVMSPSMQAARRAIELDPESGEAYIALGALEITYSRDWAATERDLRRGIALSPGDPLGQAYLSIYLTVVKRPDEAVMAARRAMDLDPLGFFTNRNLGAELYYDRHYDESRAALRRAVEIAPDKPDFVEGWNSAIAEVQGRYADAVEADLRGFSTTFPPEEISTLRTAFAARGWKSYQQELIRYLLPKASTNCYSGLLAMSYLRLGEIPRAFQWFQREADEYCVFSMQLASDPRLDPVRHDPHYLAYQAGLKLPE